MVRKKLSPMPGLNTRFIQAMERLGYTGYSFSKDMDTSEAVVSNIRKGKNPPNVQLVERLLNKHQELDAEWLLVGRGSMFRRSGGSTDESEGGNVLELLRGMSARMERMEELLARSTALQVERGLLVDEAIVDLQHQVSGLSTEVVRVKKGLNDHG